ncbi:hypothetical protein AQF52_3508 [Streptomyces venezuelae]|nr:hypothetical protein AQF52_3508 [Streptomyces venezuelae]CUM40498.1 hypothetical protein BN2537_9961 [Streptomyces venezuelae]
MREASRRVKRSKTRDRSATLHLVADGVLGRSPAVEWVVADRTDAWPAGAVGRVLRQAAGDGGWRVVRDGAGIVVLVRQRGQMR